MSCQFFVKCAIFVCLGTIAVLLDHGTKREVLKMNNCTQQALLLDQDAIFVLVFADVHKQEADFEQEIADMAEGFAIEDCNMSTADEANATELDAEAEVLYENATELEEEAQADREEALQDAAIVNETVARAEHESNLTLHSDDEVDVVDVRTCGWLRIFCEILGQAADVHDQADTDFKIASDDYKKAVEAEEDRVFKLKQAASLDSTAEAEIREADRLSDEAKRLHTLAANEKSVAVWEWATGREEEKLAASDREAAKEEEDEATDDVYDALKLLREALEHSQRAFFYATFAMLIAGAVLAAAFLRSAPKLEGACTRLHTIAQGISELPNQRVLGSWVVHALIFLFALGLSQVDDADKMTIVTKGWMAGRISLQVSLMESTLLQALPHYWNVRDATRDPSALGPVVRNWVARFVVLCANTALEFIGVFVLFGGPLCQYLLPIASSFWFRLSVILAVGAHLFFFELRPMLAFDSTYVATPSGNNIGGGSLPSRTTIVFVADSSSAASSAMTGDATRFSVGAYGSSHAADKATPAQADVQRAVLVEDDVSTPLRFLVSSQVEKARLFLKVQVVVLAILMAIVVNNVVVWWQFYEIQDWWAPILYFGAVAFVILLFIRNATRSGASVTTLPAVIPQPWNVKGTYELVADV